MGKKLKTRLAIVIVALSSVGILSNDIVMSMNGGNMPVVPPESISSDANTLNHYIKDIQKNGPYCLATEQTRAPLLADRIPISLNGDLTILSIGDCFLYPVFVLIPLLIIIALRKYILELRSAPRTRPT